MNKKSLFLALIFISSVLTLSSQQQVKPVKNIILMIPDGTSIDVLSASRWLKVYRNEGDKLNVDPYICGTVTTFSSNAPIGDSAPTTSCYMNGFPEQASNVSMYPIVDSENDLVPLNSEMTYQPLTTLLEAMQWEQKKSSGLVVTCEFPHATPADCASHYYNRNNYDAIAPQMVYNNLSVMFGGGTGIITNDMKKHLSQTNVTYLENDKNGLLNFDGNKLWALFGERELPYDLDRDTTKIPSLAQMTRKAISILNKNKNGFFLMVEGSKVDWAAHANDPIGIMTEFLAFDKAVGEAIDFAKRDGNTLVVILPATETAVFQSVQKTQRKVTQS
ncbi:MAG: alkaline phosphatase [Paludibacteraceae bacterium]